MTQAKPRQMSRRQHLLERREFVQEIGANFLHNFRFGPNVIVEIVRVLVAAPILACGLVVAAIPLAGSASAVCYSAECVPNVARNVAPNMPCVPSKYFNYGLDANGGTLVCNKVGVWTAAGPLIGIYNVALPCTNLGTSAQGSDGVAFQCTDTGGGQLRWAHRTDTLE